MLSRLACTRTSINPAFIKSAIQNLPKNRQIIRQFAEDAKFRTRSERINEKMSLRERAMAPAGPNGSYLVAYKKVHTLKTIFHF